MTFSRTRIAACLVVLIGGGATACASVIGIGDPSLDTDEGGMTLPAEASTPEASPPKDAAPQDAAVDSPVVVPDAGQLACGAATCPIATTTCCAYHQTSGSPEHKLECSAMCRPTDATVNGVVGLKCGKPADCPGQGQRCCLRLTTIINGTSKCEASCNGDDAYTLCVLGNSSTCGGRSCRSFQNALPSSFGYCD